MEYMFFLANLWVVGGAVATEQSHPHFLLPTCIFYILINTSFF